MVVINQVKHYGELTNYAVSVNSQGGEDGMVAEIIRRLDLKNGWHVEVGASDGIYMSNTRQLLNHGWHGIYIEGDRGKFNELVNNLNENCFAANGFISTESGNRLDDWLDKTPIPNDFDILSLDIDSNEYWILKDFQRRPKLIIVEYNGNFYPNECKTIEYDPSYSFACTKYYGASAGALNKLMTRKGYTLIGCTEGLNLFFIRNDFKDKFQSLDINEIPKTEAFNNDHRQMIDV